MLICLKKLFVMARFIVPVKFSVINVTDEILNQK